jgi:tetratricopeptide (TPR) repeat protein
MLKHGTVNPEAYEFYLKGIEHFVQRSMGGQESRSHVEIAAAMFRKAADLDVRYALAHAQLAYCYTWMAIFQEPDESWANRARNELRLASSLDPDLAETHVASHLLLYSAYSGFNIEAAYRELKLAQEINPSVGHFEMGSMLLHLGFPIAIPELEKAIEINPSESVLRTELVNAYVYLGRHEEAIALHRRSFHRPGPAESLLQLNRLDELGREAEHDDSLRWLLVAIAGNAAEAQRHIPPVTYAFRHARWFHHSAHWAARIYALGGNASMAVKWLREAADNGFPSYPYFSNDRLLDRVRNNAEWVAFLADLRTRWERYREQLR